MEEKYVTKISKEDFIKLGIKGYRHTYRDGRSFFEEVAILEELPTCGKDEHIVIAIHREPNEIQIQYLMEEGNMDREDAMDFALHNECYTVPGKGYQTFIIYVTSEALKSTRDYFQNKNVKINKRVTKNVYEIY